MKVLLQTVLKRILREVHLLCKTLQTERWEGFKWVEKILKTPEAASNIKRRWRGKALIFKVRQGDKVYRTKMERGTNLHSGDVLDKTVNQESTHNAPLCAHFVMLKPYSKMNRIFFASQNIIHKLIGTFKAAEIFGSILGLQTLLSQTSADKPFDLMLGLCSDRHWHLWALITTDISVAWTPMRLHKRLKDG